MDDYRSKHKVIQSAAHHIAMECIHPQYGFDLTRHVCALVWITCCTVMVTSRLTALHTTSTHTLRPFAYSTPSRATHKPSTALKCSTQREYRKLILWPTSSTYPCLP